MRKIRAVFSDVNRVLLARMYTNELLARRGGVPPAVEAYDRAMKGEITALELLRSCRADGALEELANSISRLSNGVYETVLAPLLGKGVPVGLITDEFRELHDARHRVFPELARFRPVVVSSHCGMKKPDLQIFEHAARLIGFDPSELAFIDDKLENCRAAEAIGMCAFWFGGSTRNADELRLDLERLGLYD
jgi:FMN phosphatase YigB (HAD superfamily)